MLNPTIGGLVALVRASSEPRVILVDGLAGSGKSTLAARMADAMGDDIPVVHGDDIYEGWSGLATMRPILVGQVLKPLARGEDGLFRRWDWERSERAEEVRVPASAAFVVIEGVGVAQRAARPFASLVVYVEAPWDVRLARGLARDGDAMRTEWDQWQLAESVFLEAEGTRAAADAIVDGTQPIGEEGLAH